TTPTGTTPTGTTPTGTTPTGTTPTGTTPPGTTPTGTTPTGTTPTGTTPPGTPDSPSTQPTPPIPPTQPTPPIWTGSSASGQTYSPRPTSGSTVAGTPVSATARVLEARERLNAINEINANNLTIGSNGTIIVTAETPEGVTETTTREELTELLNLPLEFELAPFKITNTEGQIEYVYFYITEDRQLRFNLIHTPISVTLNPFRAFTTTSESRFIDRDAELIRLRTHLERGDITLRQFDALRAELQAITDDEFMNSVLESLAALNTYYDEELAEEEDSL
ncbi:MAG: hypothetical protein FWE02_05885, partial [Defluviitaleaceae bacterium]|nr:hypothetical protein [Defluviitaleaceae bacterium]